MNLIHLAMRIEKILSDSQHPGPGLQAAIREIAHGFEARTVTLHHADSESRTLTLVAAVGLPEKLRTLTEKIPFGKGMAGICVERLEPVTVCNLQTDASGVAKPGAKETGVAGAYVLPVFHGADKDTLIGTLGVGMSEEHVYTQDEIQCLVECARHLGPVLKLAGPAVYQPVS